MNSAAVSSISYPHCGMDLQHMRLGDRAGQGPDPDLAGSSALVRFRWCSTHSVRLPSEAHVTR